MQIRSSKSFKANHNWYHYPWKDVFLFMLKMILWCIFSVFSSTIKLAYSSTESISIENADDDDICLNIHTELLPMATCCKRGKKEYQLLVPLDSIGCDLHYSDWRHAMPCYNIAVKNESGKTIDQNHWGVKRLNGIWFSSLNLMCRCLCCCTICNA